MQNGAEARQERHHKILPPSDTDSIFFLHLMDGKIRRPRPATNDDDEARTTRPHQPPRRGASHLLRGEEMIWSRANTHKETSLVRELDDGRRPTACRPSLSMVIAPPKASEPWRPARRSRLLTPRQIVAAEPGQQLVAHAHAQRRARRNAPVKRARPAAPMNRRR
ncbi:hypothetical protein SEVIR_2G422002v4 [Setaria viridis]